MKKKVTILLLILILLGFGYLNRQSLITAFSPFPFGISGEAAIVMDVETGEILYTKNENKKVYPASTTKLLTALVVLEHCSLEELVTIGEEVYLQTSGEARAGLFEGQVQTVENLLGAMLLASGNDAARSLAVYVINKDRKEPLSALDALQAFASLMNEKAYELGARNSNFVNPHGLHDPFHYSTAKDLLQIAQAAKKHPVISEMVAQIMYSTKTHTYHNRNKLLNPQSEYYYEGANGLKTGFTNQAGYCLISSAKRDGKEIIVVVLGSGQETVWLDSISLLNFGFGKIKKQL